MPEKGGLLPLSLATVLQAFGPQLAGAQRLRRANTTDGKVSRLVSKSSIAFVTCHPLQT